MKWLQTHRSATDHSVGFKSNIFTFIGVGELKNQNRQFELNLEDDLVLGTCCCHFHKVFIASRTQRAIQTFVGHPFQ